MTPSRPAPGMRYCPTGLKSRSRTGTPGTLSHSADGTKPRPQKLPQLAAVVQDVDVDEERAWRGDVELLAAAATAGPDRRAAFDAVAPPARPHKSSDPRDQAAPGG